MTTHDFTEVVGREGEALAQAATPALDSLVIDCPGWTVEAMVGHLGQIQRWVTQLVSSRATEPSGAGRDEKPPAGRAVVDWYRDGLGSLVEALGGIDPEEPIWTWSDRSDAGFYHRRMAHETSIHRWDAQRALQPPIPIDAELAADGIDEVLTVGMRHSTSKPDRTYPGGTLHLHRTDGPGEWMLVPSDDRRGFTITEEHGKGDAAVRGGASDLLTYLWGRGRGGLETFGDDTVIADWARIAP